jgi:hypothetical protein
VRSSRAEEAFPRFLSARASLADFSRALLERAFLELSLFEVSFFEVSFFEVAFLLVAAARLLCAGTEMENKSERRRRLSARRVGVRLIRVICKGLSSLKIFQGFRF